MYARLKQLMRDNGYTVTEGDAWGAFDTATFQVFARLVLGTPIHHPNHVLAYPTSFPKLVSMLEGTEGGLPAPTPEPQPEMPQPEAAPIDSPSNEQPATPADDGTFDVSGGSTEPAAPSDEPPADEGAGDDTPPADDAPADEPPVDGSTGESTDTPADDTTQA